MNDQDEIYESFKREVNMTKAALGKWLDTDDSKSVGFTSKEGAEAVGHEAGRHVIRILDKKKADLTADDYHHMQKVIGYIHRHMAQGPQKDVHDSRWRYSLMNWGHDPEMKAKS